MIDLPPTAYVAIGALMAALITGFFSYANMISAKENKVSEFRRDWIEGLRSDIANYTAATQFLSYEDAIHTDELKLLDPKKSDEIRKLKIDHRSATKDAYLKALECLTRIQLRLNPNAIRDNKDSDEAKLMAVIEATKKHFNAGDFDKTFSSCDEIRVVTGPILKAAWTIVKDGEAGYRSVRKTTSIVISIGALTAIALIITAVLNAIG